MSVWDMSGMSWGDGFNLFGARKSIDEVHRLLRVEARLAGLMDERHRLEILLKVEKEKNAKTAMGHRE